MDDRSRNEREIEVRSLMGDSIRVSIEPSKTVQDLKLRLKQCFSPAASSPDFHLFFKGVKMDFQSEISSFTIGAGEFLVVVPFVKKDRQHRNRVEPSETATKDINHNDRLSNDLAESAWSDLMQDLSCFQDMSSRETLAETELKSKSSETENASDRINRLRKTNQKKVFNNKERPSFDALLNILQKPGDEMLDEQSLKIFLQYVDSSSCLSDPTTGSCVMRKADAPVGCNLDSSKSSSCLCPLWLKDLMRTFYFINVYSACLQMWQKPITISAVKEPLEQLHKFGSRTAIVDLELLSQVCPQVILIVEREEEATESHHALVITKSPVAEAGKRLSKSKVVSSMKKRETSFGAILSEAAKSLMVYDGAVYMNQGKTYLVKHLDLSSKVAWCQQADVKYYTKIRDYTDIHVIGSDIAYPARIANGQFAKTTAQAHICKVTTTWFGFRRIWRKSNQVIDTVELSLPDYSYESQAVWIRVPQSVKTAVETSHYSFRGGLHAAGHALLNVVPLFVICNQSDIASECPNPHDSRYVPERILLYDPHPGGTGISRKVQPLFLDMLTAALELLSSCHCKGDGGCPNCVQNLRCNEYNEVLHKDAALMIIKGVVDAEQSNAESPTA